MLTFDGLGNGASDRPTDPAYYADEAFAADAARVMEAAGIERAVVMSSSLGRPGNSCSPTAIRSELRGSSTSCPPSRSQVGNGHGTVVYRFKSGHHALGRFYPTFRCRLPRGSYRYCVHATDAAGNRQVKVAWSSLVVR